jgi:hypothetical protein
VGWYEENVVEGETFGDRVRDHLWSFQCSVRLPAGLPVQAARAGCRHGTPIAGAIV